MGVVKDKAMGVKGARAGRVAKTTGVGDCVSGGHF